MKVATALQSRETDEWLTPPEVFDPLDRLYRFRVDLAARSDVVARAPRWMSSALDQPWVDGPGWCNPPYSLASRFIGKASAEMFHGFTTVMLVNVATDTDAWVRHVLEDRRVCVRFIPGRVYYIAGEDIWKTKPSGERVISLRAGERGPSPHPSAVLLFPGGPMVPRLPDGADRFGTYRVDHARRDCEAA